jgi:hypothetical protein
MLAQPLEVSTAYVNGLYACIAVSITGAVSLIGLTIAKDQKVSEFRQNWIDELRKDIAKFAAHAHQIHSYTVMKKPLDDSKYWDETREDYIGLNQASMRIKLRLNRNECESLLILNSMSEMEKLFKERNQVPDDTALNRIFSIVDDLERNSPPMLKKEWRRVKSGEVTFRLIRWGAIAFFALAALLAFLLWRTLAG